MGHYIGLRFSAKLKPEFINIVAQLLEIGKSTRGAWHHVALQALDAGFLLAWSAEDRADQIPFGYPQDMPTDWEARNNLNEDVWSVCCATKNEQTLRYFLKEVLPKMSLEVPFCEVCVEAGHPEHPTACGIPQTVVVDPAMRALEEALRELDRLRAAGEYDG